MERLNFGTESKYIAIEAAVHLARYVTLRQLCVGKRVLDASCGEGYGTALLARWGAKSAVGVDISETAIDLARANFGDSGATYVCSSGENLPNALGGSKFDLIVSLETVEHVDDPALFLRNLRDLLADNGTLVISCPNDFWYYDRGGKNEYHKHQWSLEDFKTFSESILGKAAAWHAGTLAVGFSVTREDGPVKIAPMPGTQKQMLDYVEADAVLTAMDQDSAYGENDTAFYVGVWGGKAPEAVFSGFPVSMDMSRQPLFPREGAWMVNRRGTDFVPDWKVNEDRQQLLASANADRQQLLASANADRQQLLASANEDRQQLLASVAALDSALDDARREITRIGTVRNVILDEKNVAVDERNRAIDELHRCNQELLAAARRIEALEITSAESNARLIAVPWRIVAIWTKIRRLIPAWMLVTTVRMINFVRGKNV